MKMFIYWIIAIIITVSAAYYQRMTGPTYPKRIDATIGGTDYKFRLKRSQTNTHPCLIKIESPEGVSAKLYYKKYRTEEEWETTEMKFSDGQLVGELPSQPAAGKLEYYVVLSGAASGDVRLPGEGSVVIRFKGNVPAAVMIPHILIMFFAMLLSNLAGLTAIFRKPQQRIYGQWALWLLIAGGMILGPVVQKFAFGQLWTGVPLGWDLTDNKTLIAILAWVVAVIMNRKKEHPAYTVAAAVILLLVYSIPHSLFGSELDYATGAVTQG